MSAVVVMSAEDLARLVREAVRDAMNEAPPRRSDSWITIKATGLPPTSIRKLIKSGTIRAAKVGRELRVNGEDLQKHLASASAKTVAEPADVIEAVDAFEAARARARAERRRSA